MSKNHPWPSWVCFLLCVIAIALSSSLYQVSVSGNSQVGLAGSICGEGGGCDKVAESPWSKLPPANEDGTGGGISVSLLGLIYFCGLGSFFAIIGWPAKGHPLLKKLLIAILGLGALGSIAFIALMAFVVEAFCILCTGVHICNLLILALTLFFLRKHGLGADAADEKGKVKLSERAQYIQEVENQYPQKGWIVVTLLTFLLSSMSAWGVSKSIGMGHLVTKLEGVLSSGYAVEAAYAKAPKLITSKNEKEFIRPDDPIIQAKPFLRNTVVLYSDLQCPSCARFDSFFFKEVVPLFEGHLRVVYKHYPLNMHKYAIPAARAAEAGRLQGKFWEVQHEIRKSRNELANYDYGAMAVSLGLDKAKFLKDMNSVAVGKRVLEDKNMGRTKLGISSTPTVLLNGRLVERSVRDIKAFWEKRAEALKRMRLDAGQGWGADAKEREPEKPQPILGPKQ